MIHILYTKCRSGERAADRGAQDLRISPEIGLPSESFGRTGRKPVDAGPRRPDDWLISAAGDKLLSAAASGRARIGQIAQDLAPRFPWLERGGLAASSGQRGCAASVKSSNSPMRNRSIPAHAIIAPLSVQ